MKNKLFLALALAGAVACKKDKPAEPATNDVNTQVTNFINNLNPSKDLAEQVQAFASKLQNDTEMENILVGKARAGKEWNLVPFTTVKVYETEKRTLDNAVILNEDNKTGKDYSFEDYKLNFTDDRPWYFKAPYPFALKYDVSNDGWITYEGLYYTKQGVLYLDLTNKCFQNTQEGVAYFVTIVYDLLDNPTTDLENEIKKLNTYFVNEELCYESFGTHVDNITSSSNNSKLFTYQYGESQGISMLKSKNSNKSKTYKRNHTRKHNVQYKTN